jgi:ATP-dependent RNA helicase DeaD
METGNEGFVYMENFKAFNLPEALSHTLAAMGFDIPTPVQVQAIPPALEGRDILGSAQTGTGKTGAFGIPLVARLMSNSRGSALVMTPTRELAVQVMDQLQKLLGRNSSIKTALLIGGEAMPKQLQQLRARPRLLVGTPGRINDHLERGSLMLHDTNFLVLDETDRMLDMGFTIQIEKVMKFLAPQRQTLLFSATLPSLIVKMSEKYLTNPVRVSIGQQSAAATNIKQEVLHVSDDQKYSELLNQLQNREGSVIIFVKTKYGAEKLSIRLRKDRHSADAIHGDLRQNQRDRVIAAFRAQKHRIMVATDIAARGLDIPHIEHVVNYDLPQCPEDYIHRIGRTARAGAEGAAICFVTPADRGKWKAIERLLNPNAVQSDTKERHEGGRGNGAGKPNGKRRFGGKPSGERRFGGKPDGERRFGGKPDGERSGGKPEGERRFASKDGERRSAAKPDGERRPSGKPEGERRFGGKPDGERRSAGKPDGERRFAGKPNGEAKSNDRSQQRRRRPQRTGGAPVKAAA